MTATKSLKALARHVRLTFEWGAKLDWDQQDEWQKNANGYRCTLHYKGHQHTFDFWQGIGISHDPTAEGCLECLLSDSSAGDTTFENFCSEFGYDTDSRKAEKTFKACGKTAVAVRRLLGDDYETFLYADRN
jgi:hypothetical protein